MEQRFAKDPPQRHGVYQIGEVQARS